MSTGEEKTGGDKRRTRDFVVYPCESCGRRIFTERTALARAGKCPLCGAEHIVGGKTAQTGIERRRAERVTTRGAKVAVDGLPGETAAGLAIHPLGDLSATGVSLSLPAPPDPARPGELVPPTVAKGDVLRVGLRLPELLRPRTFWAEVKRITMGPDRASWLLGLQFVELGDDERAELRALVRRLGGRE
jgi:hypothetical protein